DDEAGVKEEQFAEYYVPSEIDIDNVSPDDRARSYIKRAGILIATSPEAKAQEHREATTLMAIYTSPADVPPSPKEPPPPDMDEMVPEVLSFGELPDHVKARQEKYFAMTNPQKPPTPQSQPPQNNQFVLNLLNSIQNPSHPHTSIPPVASQPAPISLEQTINMLRQQQPNNPPAPPPMPQPNIDSRLLAMLYPGQQQPPQPQPQPQQGGIPANLAAIISQLTNQTQQNQQPAQPEVTQTHTTGHYEDPERKRMRESGGYDGEDRWKRNRTGGAPNKKHVDSRKLD
ncbi:hypothetical protein COL922a_013969, partial [Colletotrichum nupharicola]